MCGSLHSFLSLGLSLFLGLSVSAGGSDWDSNYDAALSAAISKRRPVLVLFDGPATSAKQQNLLGGLLGSADFEKFVARQCILCRIPAPGNGDGVDQDRQHRQIRANLGIDSLPAIVLLDPDGRTLGSPRLRTGQRPAEVIADIRELIPQSMLLAETNDVPVSARGPLTVDLASPTNRPTAARTLDLRSLRSDPGAVSHPSLIVIPHHDKPQTNHPSAPRPR